LGAVAVNGQAIGQGSRPRGLSSRPGRTPHGPTIPPPSSTGRTGSEATGAHR